MKGNWKRCLCMVLAMTILLTVPGNVFGAEKPEWRYGDSLFVIVSPDEARTFSPEDFPGIGCEKVFVLRKFGENSYELVLMLNHRRDMNDSEYKEVIEKVLQIPMVSRAERNYRYTQHPKSYLKFNHTALYLAVNETADVRIMFSPIRQFNHIIYGVEFWVDSSYFEQNSIEKNSFLDCGITRFWPADARTESSILLPDFRPEELEGEESEYGSYYGLAGDENENLFDTIARLAANPGILHVQIIQGAWGENNAVSGEKKERLPLKSSEEECWEIENPDIAEYTLSGGYPPEYGSRGQTAAVRALKHGVTRIFAERNIMDDYVSSGCPVIVYEPGSKNNPGDIDHDGAVSADDALQVLKHMVGLTLLDEDGRQTADLDGNKRVTAYDALLMLKIATGSINQEFVINY